MKDLAIIILAAGKSSRMGKITKQLVKYNDETLIKIAVKKALEISNDIYVVLGHDIINIKKELENTNVNIVENTNYEKGIGTSISCATKVCKDYENLLFILCDQPFIDNSHLNNLKSKIDNQSIIATVYEDSNNATVPAIFPKKYYDELIKLNKDMGAKEIINQNNSINIKLKKELSIDIDTIEDIDKFLSKK